MFEVWTFAEKYKSAEKIVRSRVFTGEQSENVAAFRANFALEQYRVEKTVTHFYYCRNAPSWKKSVMSKGFVEK
jgi:hypothetical protein